MPIVNGQYISPTWQNGGPPPIDQTELQAITDTLASLDATGGGEGRRYARFVVGTSTTGWTKNDCDFLCDGTDDQVEINAAIAAFGSLSGGNAAHGTIVLLDGNYNLTAPLTLLNHINLVGSGGACLVRETATGASSYNYMVAIQFGTIDNIQYTVSESLATPQSETFEILLGGNSSIKNCNISDYLYTAVAIESATWAGTVGVYNNYFGYSKNSQYAMDVHVLNSQNFIIENNNLNYGVRVDRGTSANLSTFSISNNSMGTTLVGQIIIDGMGGGTITENKCRSIQILNTKNSLIMVGNIVSNNLLGSGSDDQNLIVLGENTHDNIVSFNILKYYNVMGSIQDNGTNNIVYNGETSGQVTLSSSNWSGNIQTVSAPGVTANSVVTTGPTPSSMSAAMASGVYCSSQGNGTLTFTCTSTPSSSITYTYTSQEVF